MLADYDLNPITLVCTVKQSKVQYIRVYYLTSLVIQHSASQEAIWEWKIDFDSKDLGLYCDFVWHDEEKPIFRSFK